ncbi:MAG: methionyl-tRNA formyltransferase [Bacteroidales bacterium]|nr:methionyl-tRNA formyltransferase [Bacteroidales bacterium]
MKKLDKYLIKSFAGPFFMTFFIVVFILVMQFLWLYIDELVGKGLSFKIIMEFMGWGTATLIPTALPLATLLASIMTLGGLGENNELLATKAAGIPLKRILSPLIILSMLIVIGAFFISNNLIPVSYKKIYALRYDINKTKEEIKIPSGVFYDGIEGYILRVGEKDEEGLFHDVMVYDHTPRDGNKNVTLAETGYITITPDKKNMVFALNNGTTYTESTKLTYNDTTLDQSVVTFDSQTLYIPLDNYSFSRSDDSSFGNEVMAKNLKTLRVDKDSLNNKSTQDHADYVRRFFYDSQLNHYDQIDTLNAKLQPTGVFPYDECIAAIEDPEFLKARYYTNMVRDCDATIEAVNTYERNTYHIVDPLRRTTIEIYRKFTLSLACLIFFFIGAPLGAIIRKGGLGTPVIISIFFFVIYWVIDISGKKLARDGSMTPFIGTFISTAVLLPIGVFLTVKATNDSSLFNMDAYLLSLKNFWKKVVSLYYKVLGKFKKKGGRIDIVYMGTPEFAVGPLKALLASEYNVAAVVTVPDKQSGRGLKVNESAVKKYAVEKGIPVLQPTSLKDPEFISQLKSINADLFVVVAFRMLPKEVWSMPKLGTFNLHASLLPQYRGAAPINWAIIDGERQTGVTTFMIDENIDTGNILFSDSCVINSYDNAGSLHDRLMEMGSELVVKTTEAIARGTAKPSPQIAFSAIRPAPKITKETCTIDWNNNAENINLLIRGLSPYPAAHSTLVRGDEKLEVKIFEAYVCDTEEPRPAGTILTDGKTYLSVACGELSLRILDIQLAGKKRLEITEFLKGFRDADKYSFV